MTTFFCLPAFDFTGKEHQFTIATCPVVVDQNSEKILGKILSLDEIQVEVENFLKSKNIE